MLHVVGRLLHLGPRGVHHGAVGGQGLAHQGGGRRGARHLGGVGGVGGDAVGHQAALRRIGAEGAHALHEAGLAERDHRGVGHRAARQAEGLGSFGQLQRAFEIGARVRHAHRGGLAHVGAVGAGGLQHGAGQGGDGRGRGHGRRGLHDGRRGRLALAEDAGGGCGGCQGEDGDEGEAQAGRAGGTRHGGLSATGGGGGCRRLRPSWRTRLNAALTMTRWRSEGGGRLSRTA